MYRTKTETKLVWWPTPQDYNEAVQVPQLSLQDPDLRQGRPYTNALDLPRSITGSFASVYRMHCPKQDFALRLFLSNIRDQQERYALISDFVQHDDLPYTVTFDFLKQGIKVRGDWLPALKMDWLEGEQLDDYIVHNLGDPQKLGALLENFLKMMHDLRHAGIAHGDLQHGNILVCHNELRLVDYDGMFVPAMKGFMANELGHRNYQHPNRDGHHFGPYLDNFSAWVIYASIRAVQIDSRLMHQLGGGDDCLLFRQSDFMDPIHSPAFAALERHADKRLNELGRFLRAQLQQDLPHIPFLEISLPSSTTHDLHPISPAAQTVKYGARILRGNLPDWLQDDNVAVLTNAPTNSSTQPNAASPNLAQIPGTPPQATNPGVLHQTTNPGLHSQAPYSTPQIQAPKSQSKSTSKYTFTLPPVTPLTAPPPQSWTMPAKPSQQAVWLKPGVAVTLAPPLQATTVTTPPPPLSRSTSKLNKLTNTINTASQKKQQQIKSSQQKQAQLAQKRSHPATPAIALPPELVTGHVPRKVRWNPNCTYVSPRVFACLMLLNPLVWAMFNFGSVALGADTELTAHGVQVPATVTNVEYHTGSKSSYTQISYQYTVDNQIYQRTEQASGDTSVFQRGQSYPITVLPSNPTVTEGLNAPPGHKRLEDFAYFALLAIVNIITFGSLTDRSWKQRKLATNARAAIAHVDDLHTLGGDSYVQLSWTVDGINQDQVIKVPTDQFRELHLGDSEVILFDESTREVALYRFCRYIGKPLYKGAITQIGP